MLDAFEVITTSGVVLWSRQGSSAGAGQAVNSLINDIFIAGPFRPSKDAASNAAYKHDKYTLRYALVQDLGLMFVAVYQSILHLTWVDQLLNDIQAIFVTVYKDQLQKPNATVLKYDFDSLYDKQLQRLDQSTSGAASAEPPRASELEDKRSSPEESDNGGPPPPSQPGLLRVQSRTAAAPGEISETETPVETPDTSRPTTPLPPHLLAEKQRPGSRGSRRARKAANAANAPQSNNTSGDEAKRPATPRTKSKKGRVWGPDGMAGEDDGDATNLDYSVHAENDLEGTKSPPPEAIDQQSWGKKTKDGHFVLKDIDDEIDEILRKADQEKSDAAQNGASSRISAISGYFRNIVGGKTMSKEELDKPLRAMEEHLMKKNVARDAALRLGQGVQSEMVGKKTGAFESVDTALRPALENSLRKIMTPRSSLDLLQQIDAITKPSSSQVKPRPFVITILGVNGVGKSTNLAKLCYFLLQNNYKVMIAAGDTFRAGAVEQLKVHVRNLKELTAREQLGGVDIYEKGYGKDAANVAKDAIAFAASNGYDVVLVDTAGRAHTNIQLMSALEKLIDLSKPDLILQVAEALVGNDSVGQAQNFTKALGKGRKLDGFIVSKMDTVDDSCGTLVSLVHATGVPVHFIGVGQHYGDLRTLSVPWAVNLLMK
ncbi:Signal recognition particle receptor subunit alpha [Cyphellophora attinorum]|uniref:Signal recognition particle receptor subunit alpha homolog n=1 Tax=Cyphellophora attinorum TaxID=1664694 RepID=A0A0N0NJF7_9EURO|nr:Signal recognition particle receptor subunit alpha [Phialophora attinorum]KPI36931.1 Signal recognition particle receptor subunit alpha [Phialophora attinorum]